MSKEPSGSEVLSIFLVGIGCVMFGVATNSFLIGIATWFRIGGMMVCIKEWIEGVE